MLQSELMLAHLGEDRANIQVDVAWIRDLKALIDGLFAEMEIVILDLEGFLKVR